jgi:hypothetical protein
LTILRSKNMTPLRKLQLYYQTLQRNNEFSERFLNQFGEIPIEVNEESKIEDNDTSFDQYTNTEYEESEFDDQSFIEPLVKDEPSEPNNLRRLTPDQERYLKSFIKSSGENYEDSPKANNNNFNNTIEMFEQDDKKIKRQKPEYRKNIKDKSPEKPKRIAEDKEKKKKRYQSQIDTKRDINLSGFINYPKVNNRHMMRPYKYDPTDI